MKLVTQEATSAQVAAGVVGAGFYVSPRRLSSTNVHGNPIALTSLTGSPDSLENFDTKVIDTVATVTTGTIGGSNVTVTRWILKEGMNATDGVSYVLSLANAGYVWVIVP